MKDMYRQVHDICDLISDVVTEAEKDCVDTRAAQEAKKELWNWLVREYCMSPRLAYSSVDEMIAEESA